MSVTHRRHSLVVAAAALVAAATALVTPPASASTAHRPALPPGPIAALGDSYSSGEGSPPFPSGPPCDRSPRAWPLQVGAALGRGTEVLACSGATTQDLRGIGGHPDQPDQVAALARLDPRPGVVTVTIGGNDASFGPVLALCVAADCVGGLDASKVFILTALPDRLEDTYEAIRAAAPGGRLVVVGYPRLVPTRDAATVGCSWLTPKERAALVSAGKLLNTVARLAARLAHARFVDVQDALAGHELCSADPWLVPIGDLKVPVSSWAHPNPAGQRAIADAVTAALAR